MVMEMLQMEATNAPISKEVTYRLIVGKETKYKTGTYREKKLSYDCNIITILMSVLHVLSISCDLLQN